MRDATDGGYSSGGERGRFTVRKLYGRIALLCLLALAATALVACGSDKKSDGGSAGTPNAPKKLKVGFAAAVKGDPTHDQIARLTEALVKQRGWDYVYVNNNVDGPTAVSNAKLLANKGVTGVIEFQVDVSVMPTVSRIFGAKDIPWVTYSVAGPGAWIVGGSDIQAGIDAGKALGKVAQEKWDCKVDLLVLLARPSLPAPNQRVLKARDGIKQVCPDIPDSAIVTTETGDGQAAANQQAARDVLVAHPDAKNILFAGMSDEGVAAGLTAAKQLKRYDDAYAWGQGGDGIILPNPDPHLLGSVMYWLEGYPVYAMQVLDKVAAGDPPAKGADDTTESSTAIKATSCSMTAEQIRAVPPLKERVDKLIAAPRGTTLGDLYCPKDEG